MMLGQNFRRVWSAAALSNLADGMFQVALPLLALRITRSPAEIAGVFLAARLPWLVFALHAGALADRLDRRRTMVNVDLARAALIGVLAVIAFGEAERLWILYLVAFALGIGETLFDTASQSVLPMVVAREDLSHANGRLMAAEVSMNCFVGPPLGGFLVGVAMALAFVGSAVSYLCAALVMTLVSGRFVSRAADAPRSRLRTDIVEGLRYMRRHRLLRTLAFMVGVTNLSVMATVAVLPVYAVSPGPMGLSAFTFGLLLTGGAVGSLIGAFLAPRLEDRWGRAATLRLTVMTAALACAAPLLTHPILVGIALAIAGAGRDVLGRRHALPAAADRPGPPDRAGQLRLPAGWLRHHADRCRARRRPGPDPRAALGLRRRCRGLPRPDDVHEGGHRSGDGRGRAEPVGGRLARPYGGRVANPFFAPSPLPFAMPPFGEITDDHLAPAFDRGMAEQVAEVAAIVADPAAPTFENTVVPLEVSGQLLRRATLVFSNKTSADSSRTTDELQTTYAARFAAHQDAIRLDSALYRRVKAVHQDTTALDPQQQYLVERYYTELTLAGAGLSDDDKQTLTDRSELDGLTAGEVSAAAAAAEERGLDGKYVIDLVLPTGHPYLASLTSRETRRRLSVAQRARGSRGNAHDTRPSVVTA